MWLKCGDASGFVALRVLAGQLVAVFLCDKLPHDHDISLS
jgi:hypothetical protein